MPLLLLLKLLFRLLFSSSLSLSMSSVMLAGNTETYALLHVLGKDKTEPLNL